MNQANATMCQEDAPEAGFAPIRFLPIPRREPSFPPVFSFAPVLELICPGEIRHMANGRRRDVAVASAALRLGKDRRQIYRWLHQGLDDRQADTIAIMLGLHPSLIWGDWFAAAPVELAVAA